MPELKGSKTEANLLTAFAGESQARNKYTYYASKAKKDGYVILHHEPHTREKLIRLTEKGKEYADGIIGNLRLAEMEAFDETLKKYPVELAEMFAEFADQLKLAYEHYHNKSDPVATTGERKDYDEPIISKNNHRFPD